MGMKDGDLFWIGTAGIYKNSIFMSINNKSKRIFKGGLF